MTLTVAAIITSAVSLLIFGLTLFMQHGFDNLVSKWQDGAEMIMYFNQPLSADQQAEIEAALNGQPQAIDHFEYCDPDCAYALAQKLFAGDPTTLARLSPESIPVLYKIFPTDNTTVDDLKNLQASLSGLPQLRQFETNEGTFDVISKLKGFVGLYTVILSIALLIAAVLLIWNTIRTAMFARRREIEVMKLVGATDWFIRIPFMLEGLIQGLLGGARRVCGAVGDQQPLDRRRPRLPGEQRPRLDGGRERFLRSGDGAVARDRHGRRRGRRRHRRQPLLGRVRVSTPR